MKSSASKTPIDAREQVDRARASLVVIETLAVVPVPLLSSPFRADGESQAVFVEGEGRAESNPPGHR